MAILAIDLGNKRCGIAIENCGIAFAREIVERVKIIQVIKQYISEENITHIILGLPYDLYNKDLTQLEKTQRFIEKLQKLFPNISVEGMDERFSSFEAGLDDGLAEKRDDIAAQIILESYLHKNK